VAVGDTTTLNELHGILRTLLMQRVPGLEIGPAVHRDFRPGDVRHSLADISKAQTLLGYKPTFRTQQGLERAMDWYVARLGAGLKRPAVVAD
jgi:UDP-N-acetylglucosamine/UDP-N-acetylgalactosamine 4-epimerase